ncbi:MAG: hypothetical protein H6767_01920 [Candidatus Peribacteria bacterium]|nr:MAG: hypothetical protein H6767_01920 [Candidatus Peribacteria bacterium]
MVNNSEKGYYFKGEDNVTFGYLSYPTNQQQMTFHGIKIEDSYIHIFPNTQLYGESYYRYDSNPSSSTNYVDANYSFNQLGIKNTTIEVNLIQNYTFNLPYIIKDSSLSFRNTVSTGSTYDIKLQSKGGLRDTLDFR